LRGASGRGCVPFTAGLFLLTRAAADGVRVFAIAIVVGIALSGLLHGYSDLGRDVTAIAIVIILTLLYTFQGRHGDRDLDRRCAIVRLSDRNP